MDVVVLGEGMLELSGEGSVWKLAYGGDALNVAIHLARLGRPTALATALGRDEFSNELKSAWALEGLDTSLILEDPARIPGLYAIRTDESGERSFTYWRSDSAARGMFSLEGAEDLVEQASGAKLLVLSLISLAVLRPEGRRRAIDLCRRVRDGGGRVALDGNYRPRLWRDAAEALDARALVLEHCDIGLPTLDDEVALTPGATASTVAEAWRRSGVREVVVKLGPEGCLVDGRLVAPPTVLRPVDTSGAGDAFDAGYLNARLAGVEPGEAALAGHRLAGWTLMRPGAVPPIDALAPYAGAD